MQQHRHCHSGAWRRRPDPAPPASAGGLEIRDQHAARRRAVTSLRDQIEVCGAGFVDHSDICPGGVLVQQRLAKPCLVDRVRDGHTSSIQWLESTPMDRPTAATETATVSEANDTPGGVSRETDNASGADTSPRSEHPDAHTTAGKLADLDRRIDEAVHAGSKAAVEKQHAKGKKTARERVELLLDAGSFTELDEFARHRATSFGLDQKRPYGDGVVTGFGTVDGRPVCVFSQDVTIFGGSLGEVYGEKIVKILDFALKTGCPLIGLNEGGGARIQEGVVSLGLYGEIFRRNTHASGVIPQISLIMGPAAGGHVYSPALTDFVVMVDQTSQMFITGPDVIKTVTGEDVTMEELGGAHTHMAKSGTAHYVASGEQDAFDYVRELLSYLPSNNFSDPPRYPAPPHPGAIEENPTDEDLDLDTLIPDSPNQPYDMHEVITRILDDDEFLEVQ